MTRVLFVDDDRRILSGLRRQLHGAATGWEHAFAPGGPEALALLDRESFDAVVSDMLMPLVDGAQVLARVVEVAPRAARIVLSGHADPERTRLGATSAHRYLTKPCPPERLLLSLQEALAWRERLDRRGDAVLDALWSRPPASGPAGAPLLGSLHGAPRHVPPEVLALVDREPDLWTRALEVLSTAHVDSVRPDHLPGDVAKRLGTSAVLWTLHGVHLLQQAGLVPGRWQAAVRCATLAANVAREQGLPDDEAFWSLLAGLLQPLADGLGDDERRQALAWLLPMWDLPEPVLAALVLPEDEAPAAPGPAAALLAARLLGGDPAADDLCRRLDALGWGSRLAVWRDLAER